MLVARIQLTAGPQRGLRTYARVENNGATYRLVPDPFESEIACHEALFGVDIPAGEATLLAPCRPRLVVGMAHNTGAADRLSTTAGIPEVPAFRDRAGRCSIVLPPASTRVDVRG